MNELIKWLWPLLHDPAVRLALLLGTVAIVFGLLDVWLTARDNDDHGNNSGW